MRQRTFNWRKRTVNWSHFTGARYAVFCSLGREIRIGTLSVATLASVLIPTSADAQVKGNQQQKQALESEYDLEELEVLGTRAPLSPQHSVRMVQVLTRTQIRPLRPRVSTTFSSWWPAWMCASEVPTVYRPTSV